MIISSSAAEDEKHKMIPSLILMVRWRDRDTLVLLSFVGFFVSKFENAKKMFRLESV